MSAPRDEPTEEIEIVYVTSSLAPIVALREKPWGLEAEEGGDYVTTLSPFCVMFLALLVDDHVDPAGIMEIPPSAQGRRVDIDFDLPDT